MAVVLTPTVQNIFYMSLPIFLPFTSRVVRGLLGAYRAVLSMYELYSRSSARNIILRKPHMHVWNRTCRARF